MSSAIAVWFSVSVLYVKSYRVPVLQPMLRKEGFCELRGLNNHYHFKLKMLFDKKYSCTSFLI